MNPYTEIVLVKVHAVMFIFIVFGKVILVSNLSDDKILHVELICKVWFSKLAFDFCEIRAENKILIILFGNTITEVIWK